MSGHDGKEFHFDMNASSMPLFGANPKISDTFDESAHVVLFCGDARDFLDTVPPGSVKLVFTSPPYNIGKNYEKRTSLDAYIQGQLEIAQELVRVLRNDGSLCWQVGNYVVDSEIVPLDILYYQLFKPLGLRLRNRIIWRFEHGLHASKRFSGRYETILWFTKSDNYTFNLDSVRVPAKYPGKRHYKGPNLGKPSGNPLGKNPSDYWEIVAQDWDEEVWNIPNVKCNHPEQSIHPCQFPVELVERCVLAMTNENDLVLDPFAGVASTLIAAIKHGRRGAGAERERAYVAVGKQRIEQFHAGELRVRPLGKPVYQPSGREKVSRRPDEWGTHGEGLLFEEKQKYK